MMVEMKVPRLVVEMDEKKVERRVAERVGSSVA